MALTTFTSGQVLTAAQMNAVQANDYNQTVSTKTASYTLVAADKGTRVVMNSASATTITVNTSLFSAGDTLVLQNISTGVCTVTAGTATVSTAGSLAIPQNGSGILYFTSAGVSIFYPSAATASALTLVSATTIGTTVASVTVSNAFSATYDNYKIIISSGVGSAGGNLGLQLGATTTAYYHNLIYGAYSGGGALQLTVNNGSSFSRAGTMSTDFINFNVDISNPFLSKFTYMQNNYIFTDSAGFGAGYQGSTTSFTAFTITPSTGTLTGGTIRVYGYANS